MFYRFDRMTTWAADWKRRVSRSAILLPALAMLSAAVSGGCGGSLQTYSHPEADLGFYTKVGVLPFKSLAADRFAGEKFAIEFTTTLLAAELFEVVDYGVFVNSVTKAIGTRTPPDGPSQDQLKQIGEATGVQGVFYGSVMQYNMVPGSSGSFPTISVEARFIDVETGTVVWMATMTERGGPKTPIIGVGETHTLGELSQSMCKEMVSKIQ
jgi:hypothetical protein